MDRLGKCIAAHGKRYAYTSRKRQDPLHCTAGAKRKTACDLYEASRSKLPSRPTSKCCMNPRVLYWVSRRRLGVNLDVYTIAGLEQRLAAVSSLEESMASTSIN